MGKVLDVWEEGTHGKSLQLSVNLALKLNCSEKKKYSLKILKKVEEYRNFNSDSIKEMSRL